MRLELVRSLDDRLQRDLFGLFAQEWWSSDRSPSDIKKMLMHSDLVYGYSDPDTGQLAAFARVLTDGIYKAVILDFIVAKTYRRTGLGRTLMKVIMEDPDLASVRDFELYCKPELLPFYRRFGFIESDDDIKLLRSRRP